VHRFPPLLKRLWPWVDMGVAGKSLYSGRSSASMPLKTPTLPMCTCAIVQVFRHSGAASTESECGESGWSARDGSDRRTELWESQMSINQGAPSERCCCGNSGCDAAGSEHLIWFSTVNTRSPIVNSVTFNALSHFRRTPLPFTAPSRLAIIRSIDPTCS
jgi:hypothetical protein